LFQLHQEKGAAVLKRKLTLVPVLALAVTTLWVTGAPTAAADCNTTGGSTLCSSSGTVTGSSGAPTSVPRYNPYPCYGDPTCDYYDTYDPGIAWDLPNLGGGGGIGVGGGIFGGRN
jgi:hypothetical protein